jgi:hypothetical protein
VFVIDNNSPTLVSIGYNQTPKVNSSFTTQIDAEDRSSIVSAEISIALR